MQVPLLSCQCKGAGGLQYPGPLGTGEGPGLGAATATVLESASMNAREEIVSPRIVGTLYMRQ